MKLDLKNAEPGERWVWTSRYEGPTSYAHGVVVHLCGENYLAVRHGMNGEKALYSSEQAAIFPWRKTHNADGTPYEAPNPLPDFGECWARQDSSEVYVWSEPSGLAIAIGKMAPIPEIQKHLKRVRLRLEVIE